MYSLKIGPAYCIFSFFHPPPHTHRLKNMCAIWYISISFYTAIRLKNILEAMWESCINCSFFVPIRLSKVKLHCISKLKYILLRQSTRSQIVQPSLPFVSNYLYQCPTNLTIFTRVRRDLAYIMGWLLWPVSNLLYERNGSHRSFSPTDSYSLHMIKGPNCGTDLHVYMCKI